ncbi:unnamed protein product [Ectocarpus sp. 4 AP-2014]
MAIPIMMGVLTLQVTFLFGGHFFMDRKTIDPFENNHSIVLRPCHPTKERLNESQPTPSCSSPPPPEPRPREWERSSLDGIIRRFQVLSCKPLCRNGSSGRP